MRSIFKSALILAVISSFVWTISPAGASSTYSITDARRDSRFGIDIKSTTLDRNVTGQYRVRIYGYEFLREKLNRSVVFFDTRAANAGPEYTVGWGMPNDGVWQRPNGPIYDGNDFKAKLCTYRLLGLERACRPLPTDPSGSGSQSRRCHA